MLMVMMTIMQDDDNDGDNNDDDNDNDDDNCNDNYFSMGQGFMRCAVLEVTLARELFPEQNTRLGIVGIIMMMIKRMTIMIIIDSDFHPQ